MDKDLYKVRSLAKCTQAAYDLLSTNLKKIISRTWMPALMFAVISALTHLLVVSYPAMTDVFNGQTQDHVTGLLAITCSTLLSFFVMTWGFARVVSLLNGQSFKTNWPRMGRLYLLCLGLTVLLLAIIVALGYLPILTADTPPSPNTLVLALGIMMLGAVITALCLIPTYYSVVKYCMEPEQKLGTVLGKAYRRGWRSWGFLFSLALLVGLIICLLATVVLMPLVIVQTACYANILGMSMGDPSGMPAYYPWLSFAAALLCMFVWFYIMIWEILVFYYAYGTIEAKSAIRKQVSAVTTKHDETDFPEIS